MESAGLPGAPHRPARRPLSRGCAPQGGGAPARPLCHTPRWWIDSRALGETTVVHREGTLGRRTCPHWRLPPPVCWGLPTPFPEALRAAQRRGGDQLGERLAWGTRRGEGSAPHGLPLVGTHGANVWSTKGLATAWVQWREELRGR